MQQETAFIYSLEYPEGNIRWIGKTNNPKNRLKNHISESKTKKTSNRIKWLNKLNNNNQKPILNIVDEVPVNEWEFWEQHYISLYKTFGFNLTNMARGGKGVLGVCKYGKDNPFFGKTHSKSSTDKNRLAHLKENLSEETLNKRRDAQKNRPPVSQNTKDKMSLHRKGKNYIEIFGEEKAKELTKKNSGKNHYLFGKTPPIEAIEKTKLANSKKPKLECPHCKNIVDLRNAKRWHFDNCKQNPNYKQETIKCPHCDIKSINIGNMKRYHFDNCKNKPL